MKKTNVKKTAAACGLCLALLTGSLSAGAAYNVGVQSRAGAMPSFGGGQQTQMFGPQFGQQAGQAFGQNGQRNGASQFGGMMQGGAMQTATSAGAIVAGTTTNSAASLEADYANAETITMSDENNSVKIKAAGTYVVTGNCSDGNITVTKGTTGVVLILKDLDLTSTTGATLSVNKGAEAKLIVSGSVTLTDAENAADENSADEAVADAFDGAAIKVKSGASAYLTGDGTLTVNGSAKNGIKVSAGEDDGNGSLVIDGATINITAANDAINAEYDLAILSGTLTITAGDDALHADRILTVGEDGSGPSITVKSCTEGLEGTVVNLAGGTVSVTSSDDGVNAANSDGTYASLGYSINVTGAKLTVNAPRADGLDSNGNINLISGSATINSASTGGDAGMDYDGQLYISDEFDLNNMSGVSNMGGGMMGGMNGQMGGMNGQMGGMEQAPAQNGTQQAPAQNTAPAQDGQGVMGGIPFGAPSGNGEQTQSGTESGRQFDTQAPFGNWGGGQMPMQNRGMMGGMGAAGRFPFRQMMR